MDFTSDEEHSRKLDSSTSHLNRHLQKSYKMSQCGVDSHHAELEFGGSRKTLSKWVYSRERFHESMAAYVDVAEMPLCMIDFVHFIWLVKNYLDLR